MSHFVYRQLPASGLGIRDPRRPYVTGGIGAGIPVFITCIGDQREPFYGVVRDPFTGERFAVYGIERTPIYASRSYTFVTARVPHARLMRFPSQGERSSDLISARARMLGGDRSSISGARTPHKGGSRQPPDHDVDC